MKIKKIITFEVPDSYMESWMEDLACDHSYDPIFDDIHDKKELETCISEGNWQEEDRFFISEETIFEDGALDKLHKYLLDKYLYYKGE